MSSAFCVGAAGLATGAVATAGSSSSHAGVSALGAATGAGAAFGAAAGVSSSDEDAVLPPGV